MPLTGFLDSLPSNMVIFSHSFPYLILLTHDAVTLPIQDFIRDKKLLNVVRQEQITLKLGRRRALQSRLFLSTSPGKDKQWEQVKQGRNERKSVNEREMKTWTILRTNILLQLTPTGQKYKCCAPLTVRHALQRSRRGFKNRVSLLQLGGQGLVMWYRVHHHPPCII